MPARLVPKSVTPVSRPSRVASTEDTIWSKTLFGIKSFFIGLPPPVEFVHVFGGDDDCLGKRVFGRVPHVPSPQVTEPAVADPMVAFRVRIHVYGWFLIRVFSDGSLDDDLINPSRTLAPQPSPKSGPSARFGERLEVREDVFHQPPAATYNGISEDETAFRADLGAQSQNFPILPKQPIGNLFVPGVPFVSSGLIKVFSKECLDQLGVANESYFFTVCAGSKVAGTQLLDDAYSTLAKSIAQAGLGGFQPYSPGGKAVLAGVKVFVDASFSSDPGRAVLRSAAVQLLSPLLGKVVGEYLQGAEFTEQTIEQRLGLDNLTTARATATVNIVSGQLVTATVAWAYNPYTHYVVAFISSDQSSPSTFYVVYYKADSQGDATSKPVFKKCSMLDNVCGNP